MVRVAAAVLALIAVAGQSAGPPAPLVDHHQHFFSPSVIALSAGNPGVETIDAAKLVSLLDAAGIGRAAVLSVAYTYANPNRPTIEDEYAKVRAENDWTSAQVARFPDRLRGFCGVNPLKDYAVDEIARCAKDRLLRTGLKLHFGNSDVDLDNAGDVERVRRVFRAANERRMAIAVHMRASVTRGRPYGAKQARVFVNDVLPAAPDITIQIAHLAGAGTYDDPAQDEALTVFIDAIAKGDRRVARVMFDVSGIAGFGKWMEKSGLIAKRLRAIGMPRLLYGSDGATAGGLTPRDAWAAFSKLPLTAAEFHTIATNVAPYLK